MTFGASPEGFFLLSGVDKAAAACGARGALWSRACADFFYYCKLL